MTELLQQLVNGLALGGVYALIAIGFSLIYSIAGLVNFAYGDTFMFGVMLIWWLSVANGTPFLLSIPLAIVVAAAISVLTERVADRPLRARGVLFPLLATFGVAMAIRSVAQVAFGPETHWFPPLFGDGTITLAGVRVRTVEIVTLAIVLGLVALLTVFLRRTQQGRALRAASIDLETLELMGVPRNRLLTATYAISGALGLVAGVLLATTYNAVDLMMGFDGLLKGFIAAVIGGLGSISAALVGGLVLGLVEVLVRGYITTSLVDVFAFGIVIAVLIVRPRGLLGQPIAERV